MLLFVQHESIDNMNFADIYPDIPENVPRMGNKITRWLGCMCMKLSGWDVKGTFPNENKVVIAALPHTSNWDFILALIAMGGAGVRLSFLMKKEAFFWPFKNFFMAMGGIPVDRNASEGVVEQMISWYNCHSNVWLAIAPEGTRSNVKKLKTGFLRIANSTKSTVLIVSWDYSRKTILLDRVWPTSNDLDQDAENIHQYIIKKYGNDTAS